MKKILIVMASIFAIASLVAQTNSYQIKIANATLSKMTSGTVYRGYLAPAVILNKNGNAIADTTNSSFSDLNAVFDKTKIVADSVNVVSAGQFYLNHTTGYYKVKAAKTLAPSVSWITPDIGSSGLLNGTTVTSDSVAVAGSSVTAVSSDQSLLSGTLINASAVNMFVSFGGTARQSSGILLAPNGSITYGRSTLIPFTGNVSVISASGSGNILTRTLVKQ